MAFKYNILLQRLTIIVHVFWNDFETAQQFQLQIRQTTQIKFQFFFIGQEVNLHIYSQWRFPPSPL